MSNFIRYALGHLGFYHTPRTVLATIHEPQRDPHPEGSRLVANADDDEADLAEMAAELWREEDADADADEEEGDEHGNATD